MGKTVKGICRLCGQEKDLTFEHVPPKSAFNSIAVKEYPSDVLIDKLSGADDRLPWDFNGIYGKINQNGSGDYYLCNECNSNTGSWYISEYVRLANTFHEIIVHEKLKVGNYCSFHLYDFYPLRFFKAIMTMYCDINNNCMGDNQLREYLLEKESSHLDLEKYTIYLYMASPSMYRIRGLSYLFFDGNKGFLTSEVGCYPIGTILCINKPKSFMPPGLLINSFAEYGYDEKCSFAFGGMPFLEINSLAPLDFRSKETIERLIDQEKDS